MIDSYRFGAITVNGKTYTSDIKIIDGKVHPNWWRKQGHFLQLADIGDILESNPDIVIIGTGASGIMKVDQDVIKALNDKGCKVHVLPSADAVEKFNALVKDKGPDKLCLAIHLTC